MTRLFRGTACALSPHPSPLRNRDSFTSLPLPTVTGDCGNSKELFSIAPMMGHTNRHYRYFVRLFSERTHLYTEMVPASQIVQAFRRARALYLTTDAHEASIAPEEIQEVMERLRRDPGKEYHLLSAKETTDVVERTLTDLIGHASNCPSSSAPVGAVVLQIGGGDPEVLRQAAAIGAAYGGYVDINLNCGCPSNAVRGRSAGAALMRDPSHVAHCVEAMQEGIFEMGQGTNKLKPNVTVKHRLGVRDAATFDASADRSKDDAEAYRSCRQFVNAIALTGAVAKCHVHARYGLLGDFTPSKDANDSQQQLWVPGNASPIQDASQPLGKVDHKRMQVSAKKRARQATIQNRNVPPLRPSIVNQLAEDFPSVEFVTNGGVKSLDEVSQVVRGGRHGSGVNNVVGAMVGRAAINHPCSFAAADTLWASAAEDQDIMNSKKRPTRGDVLLQYIEYCDAEEERMAALHISPRLLQSLRKHLIAVPFHLFIGEDGNDAFQRQIRKLTHRSFLIKASSVLSGAASFVSDVTLNKCVDDYVSWDAITVFDGYQRSSALQRVIY